MNQNIFNSKKWLAAHRGAHDAKNGIIENTLPAFVRAINLGADMIELDIQKTKDDMLVIYHGANNRILYQGEKKEIRELTCAQVLEAGQKLGFILPTFAEVVKLTRGKIALDIELKKNPGAEKKIVEILFGNLHERDQFVISSFEESFIKAVKEYSPAVRTGILVGTQIDSKDKPELLLRCIHSKADFWAPRYNIIGDRFLKEAEEHGKELITWVVNSKRKIKKYLKMDQVRGVITDNVEEALA